MTYREFRRAGWILAAGLFLGSGLARADDTQAAPACAGASKAQALTLAQVAREQGDLRRASACFHLAGEPLLADRALAENFARTSTASSQRMNETIESARRQARAIRESLRKR